MDSGRWKRKRINTEYTELKELYKTSEIQIVEDIEDKKEKITIHLKTPINKNWPKNILFEIPEDYPFNFPTIMIETISQKINYEETIKFPKSMTEYIKEFASYPNDHFFCPTFLKNIWTPSNRLQAIIIEIERINKIKTQTKYAFFLEKIFPSDIRKYITEFIPL